VRGSDLFFIRGGWGGALLTFRPASTGMVSRLFQLRKVRELCLEEESVGLWACGLSSGDVSVCGGIYFFF
jgi:hypothetical protein